METIVLKIMLCSGIVLGFYYLFLAKEKTFIFNRFYLILGLVFSLSTPFITIETQQTESKKSNILFEPEIQQQISQTSMAAQVEIFDYIQLLWIAYFIISGILVLKIMYSVVKIKALKGKKQIYQNRNLFLLEQDLAPFSFWNTIYLSEKYFHDSKIDARIFLHEEIHVTQKHSLDILFVEIIKAIFWLNPFIYFYKRAMVINHEFIADQKTIERDGNIKNYQELILKEIIKQQNINLIHQFNFNNTKKRFIMMSTKNSKFAKVKNYLVLPVSAILFFSFIEKIPAQADSQKNAHSRAVHEDHAIPIDLETASAEEKQLTKELDKVMKTANIIKADTITPKKAIEAKIVEIKDTKSDSEANYLTDSSIPPSVSQQKETQQADSTPPEYPGGMNQFRNDLMKKFDSSILPKNEDGYMRTDIQFTIEKDGSVNSISTSGKNEAFNNEASKTLKAITKNVKWKPATKNNEPIAYHFKMPLMMSFQNYKKPQ